MLLYRVRHDALGIIVGEGGVEVWLDDAVRWRPVGVWPNRRTQAEATDTGFTR